ncbi:hypothetical protein ACROYT_G042105 [Oculina patagonica]
MAGRFRSALLREGNSANGQESKGYPGRPTPSNVTALRSFIGMLAALSNFIQKLSTLARHPVRPVGQQTMELDVKIDKEALAIMFGLKRFCLYLYGRHFTILTDHKPLERILGPKTAIPSLTAMRLQRLVITLAAFNYSIKSVPSKQNAVADALSRLHLPSTNGAESSIFKVEERLEDCLPFTYKEIRHATRVEPVNVLSRVLEFLRSSWPKHVEDQCLKPFFQRRYEL